jgi:hypothetical protein
MSCEKKYSWYVEKGKARRKEENMIGKVSRSNRAWREWDWSVYIYNS